MLSAPQCKTVKYVTLDTPTEAAREAVRAQGRAVKMVTFYRPESHRPSMKLSTARKEAAVDQVLIRLLLHLGAGLQVGKPYD